MRLHHLSVSAFGPFAGVEEVDFDELGNAGLFLLTGPTGAGKTTVLDAVCFALYGSVPGARGVKALKSQHAPPEARPEVVLDFSVRDRRFVVRRSPEWTRPKRRGHGVTTENASASLLETTDGQEHLLSSRAQEVGHFVGELVGMQATQFVQVAMLPQGEFQQFLRATSQDRHAVLQHLFRTDRFARIEEWVQDHSRSLKERSATAELAVRRAVDAMADRLAQEPPDLDGTPLAWAAHVVDTAEASLAAARAHHTSAAATAATAREEHHRGLRLRALVQRRHEAATTLDDLEREADEAELVRRRLSADERAARCLPVLRMLTAATDERDRAASAWPEVADRLPEPVRSAAAPGSGSPGSTEPIDERLADLERRTRSRMSKLEALAPREAELLDARRARAAAGRELEEVTREHARVSRRVDELPDAVTEARATLEQHVRAAGRADALTIELRRAHERRSAAAEAEQHAASLTGLREAERDARDRAADARELVQELTARRLAGMAAELAGALAEGRACQVCGSVDHPAPARPADDAVSEAEQAEAAARYESLRSEHTAATGALLQAQERLEALRAAADLRSLPEAQADVASLEEQLAQAHVAERARGETEQLLQRLLDEQHQVTSTAHDLATRRATLQQATELHDETIAAVASELAAAVGPEDAPGTPLAELLPRLEALVTDLAAAREALHTLQTAATRQAEVADHVGALARENGFADVLELRQAVLDEPERERLREFLQERADAAARAHAVLQDPEIRALEDDSPAPAVEQLAERVADAELQETAAARQRHQLEERVEALHRLRVRLQEALISWAPLREEFDRADAMAKLVRGMGADNQLQMRLSAYVLATRLDQVVAAANERLGHMRDQRYLLQRTGRAARKGAQAGLGLEVVDQWTGDVREPTTLSGGETFVVSLSLALGLADVVTQEAGGTEIETLFVDEGFGTLDADTLDDVMDRLDELRAGGRAVGVISHVGELRNRIPMQLHVEKRRDGSSLRLQSTVA